LLDGAFDASNDRARLRGSRRRNIPALNGTFAFMHDFVQF
jgi:hypothetical protein